MENENKAGANILTPDQAIRLARIVKGCTSEQMVYIRSVLEAANIPLPTEEEITDSAMKVKDPWKRRNNGVQSREKWKETNDDVAIALRKAYDAKLSFTTLSIATGIGRSELYKYMWGERTAPQEHREVIMNKLREVFEEKETEKIPKK